MQIEDVVEVEVHHREEEVAEILHSQMILVIAVDRKVIGPWIAVKMIMVNACVTSRMENAFNVENEDIRDLIAHKMVALVDTVIADEVAQEVEADLHVLVQYLILLGQDLLLITREEKDAIDLTAADPVHAVITDLDQDLQDIDDVVVEVSTIMTAEGIRVVDLVLLVHLKKEDPDHQGITLGRSAQTTNAKNCPDNLAQDQDLLEVAITQDHALLLCDHLPANQILSSIEAATTITVAEVDTITTGVDHLARHPLVITTGPKRLIADLNQYRKTTSNHPFALHPTQEIIIKNNKSN